MMQVEQIHWSKAGDGEEIVSGHFRDSGEALAIAEVLNQKGIRSTVTLVGGGTLAVFVMDVQAFLSSFPGIHLN